MVSALAHHVSPAGSYLPVKGLYPSSSVEGGTGHQAAAAESRPIFPGSAGEVRAVSDVPGFTQPVRELLV